VSAYRTVIDQTTRTIERRARYFRNQVVTVISIAVLVVIAAMVSRSPSALWAFFLLVPACGLFFYADTRALNDWRSELLAAWITRDIDFAAFGKAIRANPTLPTGTMEGMLRTLPSAGDLITEQKVLTPTRRAIAAASLAFHRRRGDALLLNAIVSGIVVGALLSAPWMPAWVPLIGLTLVALLPLISAWRGRWQYASYEAEVAAARGQAGLSDSDYERIRAGLL